jgi:hypothetical protein
MRGMRQGATTVLKWFSALYAVLIVVQVYLAGEGIFGMSVVTKDKCDHASSACVDKSTSLDAHRALGFFLTIPGAILFLIVALLAWHPNKRIRTVSIVVPILTFVQTLLAALPRWGAGLHPVNAFIVLGLFIWLFFTLRRGEGAAAAVTA